MTPSTSAGSSAPEQLAQNYDQLWIDLATIDGQLSGVPFRASTKSIVWYPVAAFEEADYEIPTTWDEMIALSDQIVADGSTPWCISIEDRASTGWVATDWVEEIVLRTQPPEVYDQWVAHARVAGELPVHAVERERDLQQHRAGDEPRPVAGRERRGGEDADDRRQRRHVVRRPPAAGGPARDVLRVRADEEAREEAVVRLDGGLEQRRLLVEVAVRADACSTSSGESGRAQNSRRRWLVLTRTAERHEPVDQQRRDVLLRGGQAPAQLRLLVRGELARRPQLRPRPRARPRPSRRRSPPRRRRCRRGSRRRAAAASASSARSWPRTRRASLGQRAVEQLGEPRATSAAAARSAAVSFSTPRNVPFGSDQVVGRARAEQQAAPGDRAERDHARERAAS